PALFFPLVGTTPPARSGRSSLSLHDALPILPCWLGARTSPDSINCSSVPGRSASDVMRVNHTPRSVIGREYSRIHVIACEGSGHAFSMRMGPQASENLTTHIA